MQANKSYGKSKERSPVTNRILRGACCVAVITAVAGVCLSACTGKRHQDRFRWFEIVGSIIQSKKATGEPEYLDVRRVMPFGWEKFFVFPPYTPVDDIEKALGFGWRTANKTKIEERDDITLLIFVKSRTVQEYVEHPRSKGDFSRLTSGYPYSPVEAYFEVVEEIRDGRSWFFFQEAQRSP